MTVPEVNASLMHALMITAHAFMIVTVEGPVFHMCICNVTTAPCTALMIALCARGGKVLWKNGRSSLRYNAASGNQKPNQVALMHDIAGAWEALKIDECALRRHAQQKAGRSRSRQILLPLPRQILLPISRGALPRQRHVPAPLPRGGTTPPRHSPRKGESVILFPICSNYQLI